MDNYIFITHDGHPLPIADRLKDEGKTVVVGIVDPPMSEMSAEANSRRLSLYDGLLEKENAKEVFKFMESISNKDEWFVMFDYGDLWEWSQRALQLGFRKGVFPTEDGYRLEKERKVGKAFAEANYPDLEIIPAHEFKSTQEAASFLEDNKDKIFVLKAESGEAETVVPATHDAELAHRQLLGALESESAEYEKDGFTLEEKINNPIELSPVMVFWEGNPLFSLVEIENKPIGSANIGRLTGGCQNLTIQTPLSCRLNAIAFPRTIHEMAKDQPGVGIYDAGLLHDGKKLHFTEFCGQRWGWDGIFSEIAMCRDDEGRNATSRHFDMIAAGQSPLTCRYGAAVRLFQTQPDPDYGGLYQGNYTMDWLDEASEGLFLYCIKKASGEGARFVSVGYMKDLGVAVGASDYLRAAVDRAYHCARAFAMTGTYYRPKLDFLSEDYPTSIMSRYNFLVHSGLL